MAHFVTLIRFTQKGIAAIKDSPTRLDGAKKAAGAVGGKLHAWYLTLGHYDAIAVWEFPSDEVYAKAMLTVATQGNITTETLKAFTEEEYRKMLGSLS
jgi:uncharacterized protein with GYD domain